MAGADKRGELYQRGYESFGQAIGGALGDIGQQRKELADKREQVAALESGWELLSQQAPDLLGGEIDEKFRTGSLGAKQGLFTQALAALQRQDQQQRQEQDYGLRRRGMELQEGAFLREGEPKLPVPYEVPEGMPGAGSNILVNPGTGSVVDLPQPPDTSGAMVAELPGTGYGIPVYNGRPMGGAIPMNMGRQNAQGFRLEPVQGTGMALAIGPDGKPLPDLPAFQMKKATDLGGMFRNIIGKGEYEPVTGGPSGEPPVVRTFRVKDPVTGEFVKRDAQWDPVTQTWLEPSVGENMLLESPDKQPGAMNGSNPEFYLEKARKAAGY